ncbi:1851_t:CDS:2 [Entrophospora sp. SA101]|nr:1851_t:CDS:2 [Entrophospora sp. SA101]CAJ0832366.1 16532_t:CDS:2 [Entrophospora sp. SA101]
MNNGIIQRNFLMKVFPMQELVGFIKYSTVKRTPFPVAEIATQALKSTVAENVKNFTDTNFRHGI